MRVTRRFATPMAAALILAGCSRADDQKVANTEQSQSAAPAAATISAATIPVNTAAVGSPTETEVPLEADGGTFVVPVVINGAITLKFTIDSGASVVTIPADVASTLVRTGTITDEDFIGSQTFTLADGSTVPSAVFRIRSLKIGTLVLRNVTASVTNAQGSLLLGQSFLARLTTWSLDNQRHVLVLKTTEAGARAEPESTTAPQSIASATMPDVGEVATASPTTSDIAPAEKAVAARTLDYFATWSAPDDGDGQAVRKYFANFVKFYGSVIDLDTLMQKNAQFCRRWPERTYTVRPGETTVSCDATNTCTVRGVVDWSAASEVRGAHSTGVAEFLFTFRNGLIEAESGKVLSRG